MSQPLQERRSERNREPRRLYTDEQAYHHFEREEKAEVSRAVREALATVEPSDSAESDLPSADGSSSEDERKAAPNDENIATWTEQLHDVHAPVCNATASVQLPRHRPFTELGYLQCFIDQTLIDIFVTNTNLYATARQATAWEPVTAEEMWRHLAVRIRQGIVPLPELHHYWEADYRDSYISQLMGRNRFMQLHRYFHIVPPVPRGQRQTVVEKTAPFYHQCQALFQQYFEPGAWIAVDETMVRFEGRSGFITLIKGKPTPMGFKLFTVAADGYILGFRIYHGKGSYARAQGVLHTTVIGLVRPWADANRRLFFDNLYTSPALCDHLLRLRILSCGTCRPNRRGLPTDLPEAKKHLAKGEMKAWQRGQLGCLL